MTLTTEERVANGIEWLDANVPDWRTKVDKETLNIGACETCVLGQVFKGRGGFGHGVNCIRAIDHDYFAVMKRGFMFTTNYGVATDMDVKNLNAAWISVL